MQASEANCNSKCTANTTEICGGSNRLSMYATGQRGHWSQLFFTATARPSHYDNNGTYIGGSLIRHAVITNAGGTTSNYLGAGVRFSSENVLVEHVRWTRMGG